MEALAAISAAMSFFIFGSFGNVSAGSQLQDESR
jgi:hypothetical protein